MDATTSGDGLRPRGSVASPGMSPELAGLAELVELLDVSKRTAQKYAAKPDFPEPVDRLASGPVWRRAEVEAWAKANLPLKPGRPLGKGSGTGEPQS